MAKVHIEDVRELVEKAGEIRKKISFRDKTYWECSYWWTNVRY